MSENTPNKVINKLEFIRIIAEKNNITLNESEAIINSIFETIEESLVLGNKVRLQGFGVFEPRERQPAYGRNPKGPNSPENSFYIEEHVAPFFKPSKNLRSAMNPKE